MIATLTAVVESLFESEIELMSDAAIRAEYLELSLAADRIECRRSRLLVGVHQRGIPFENGASSTPVWVQAHTGQRAGEARASLDAGLACATLPLVAKAWEQGEISASAARAICEGRPDGYETEYGENEEKLVRYAADRDWRRLRAMIAHCKRCADALNDREPADRNGLFLSKTIDRWAIKGDLDDLAGETIDQAIHAEIGTISDDDTRSPAKRRADALAAICRFRLDSGGFPIEGGEAPHITVCVPWDVFANRATAPAATPNLFGPSLSPAQLDELLCDCNLGRIVFNVLGQPVNIGRAERSAPRHIRRAVGARDGGCRFPGCDRKPSRCKIHHVHQWDNGGETSVCNCICLCQFHHSVIHRKGWTDTFDGTTYTVTNPLGVVIGSTTAMRA